MGVYFSLFWKIENVSLLCPYDAVESPDFSINVPGAKPSGRMFYLRLDTGKPDEAITLTLKSRCGFGRESRRRFSFSFSAKISAADYHGFHAGGKMDPEIRNGRGLYKSLSFLMDNKKTHLQRDSLSFRVEFSSGCGASSLGHLCGVTRIPEKKVTFEWEVANLSAGGSDASIPSPPLRFHINRLPDTEENRLEVTVTYNKAEWISIPCAVSYVTEAGYTITVARFTVSQESLSSGSCPKGSFLISNEVYEKIRHSATESGEKLTLVFQFRIRGGQTVSEGFCKGPVALNSKGRAPGFLFKSSSSFPAMRGEAGVGAKVTFRGDCVPGEAGENADHLPPCPADPALSSDLRSLYSAPVFSDFTLKVGERSFPVHRSVLSARSVVFLTLFEEDVEENCSEVTDVDADTLDRMLRFVYFGAFGDADEESAAKLFAAAVKYKIASLRSKCVESLASGLSAENVCRVLALADAHDDRSLWTRALGFVYSNADRVFRSDEWGRFMAENPLLAGHAMHQRLLSSSTYSG